jgi:hypothetical protein
MADKEAKTRALEVFVGEWDLEARFEEAPPGPRPDGRAWVTFEWGPGEKFLVQRWAIPIPEAPDGVAIIAFHEDRDGYLQHYFDSRGVFRVYEMSLDDEVWKLWRVDQPDFDQRWEASFGDDGATIEGTWELREDDGVWKKDFDLIYTRVV